MYNRHLVSLALLGAFFALAAGSDDSGSSSSPPASSTSPSSTSVSLPDSSPSAPATSQQYVEQVNRELGSLSSFEGSTYRGSKDAIMMEVVLFGAWAKLIGEARQYNLTPQENRKVGQLRAGVSRVQVREFPRMRAAWAKVFGQAVWEHDVTVRCGGSGNGTLRLTAAVFASNAGIATIQESLHDALALLRFRRVEYRWYEGEDEYTYYSLKPPSDGAVREIQDNGYAPASD